MILCNCLYCDNCQNHVQVLTTESIFSESAPQIKALVRNFSAFSTLFAPGKSWDNVRSTTAPYTESRLAHLVRNKCVGFPVVEQLLYSKGCPCVPGQRFYLFLYSKVCPCVPGQRFLSVVINQWLTPVKGQWIIPAIRCKLSSFNYCTTRNLTYAAKLLHIFKRLLKKAQKCNRCFTISHFDYIFLITDLVFLNTVAQKMTRNVGCLYIVL